MRNIIAEQVLGLPQKLRVDMSIAFQGFPTGPAASLSNWERANLGT